jgi:tRNA 2-thiouridine synthesizing protein A
MKMFHLDVSADTCPMTFVRTRLKLDGMAAGDVLEVRYLGEEPRRNLARSLAEQGHAILGEEHAADGAGLLRLRKGG